MKQAFQAIAVGLAAGIMVAPFVAGGVYLIHDNHPWMGGILFFIICGVSVKVNS